MEPITYDEAMSHAAKLRSLVWDFVDKHYADTYPYRRYPFRGVLIRSATQVSIYLSYFGKVVELNYFLGHDGLSLGHTTHPHQETQERLCEPLQEWFAYIGEEQSKRRSQARATEVGEELAATVWAPHRVEKLIAEGGMDAIDL